MCFGDSTTDTLDDRDRSVLHEAARRQLPHYEFSLRANDTITWAVFAPPASATAMPRFTICRIEPCVMVMVEDHADRRRFCSAPTIEDAIAFACQTAAEAVVAIINAHPAPALTQ